MNIKIIQDKESLLRKNEVYWKFKNNRSLKGIRITSITSLLALVVFLQNIIFFKKDFENSSKFNQTTMYAFIIVLILLLILCFTSYLKYSKVKKEYFNKVLSLEKTEIHITKEGINVHSPLIQQNVKWDLIKNFLLLENCLLLTQFNNKKDFEHIIDLNSVNNDEKNELINFLLKK